MIRVVLLVFFVSVNAGAAGPVKQPAKGAPVSGERAKSLSFEEEVVEGLNKNPFESAQHVGTGDPDAGSRLYKKKLNFKKENRRVVDDLKVSP